LLKIRVIPTLLWKNVGLVKGVSFNSTRRIGSVLPAIKVYNNREVDELILMDISASEEMRDPDYESISEFSAECFVPLTVGGGISNLEQIKQLLRAGADKICINTAAFTQPELIQEASSHFGSQCIVVSIDARCNDEGLYECFSHSGTKRTGKEPGEWAQEMERLGAGEILITSIERDGSMDGYDLRLIQRIVDCVNIPVIAAGGAGNYQHFQEAIQVSGAAAVAAASMFHFTEQTPKEAKKYLGDLGIPVRNINMRH
jgi:imidazole glycerol-phosphate synthase subunit HisF